MTDTPQDISLSGAAGAPVVPDNADVAVDAIALDANVAGVAAASVSDADAATEEATPKPSRGKRFLKYVGLGALFCAIMCVLLAGASHVLHPKNNTEEAGMMDVRTYSVLAEPEDTVDALFVGNSVVATAISPMRIWEDSGITSYVCAANGEKLTFVHYLLEQTFEKQHPKVVFLEGDMLFDPSDFAHLAREILRQTFPGILYHHRWSTLTLDDFTKPIEYTNSLTNKGFNAKARTKPAPNPDYMAPTDEVAQVSKVNRILLEDIKSLCDAHDVKLVLLAVPSSLNWNMARHNGAVQIADEFGIEFIDLNMGPSRPSIDWSTDTRDEGNHLNWRGAGKTSSMMAGILHDFGLEDHRGDEKWSAWDDALVKYHDYMARLKANPEAYDPEGAHVG